MCHHLNARVFALFPLSLFSFHGLIVPSRHVVMVQYIAPVTISVCTDINYSVETSSLAQT